MGRTAEHSNAPPSPFFCCEKRIHPPTHSEQFHHSQFHHHQSSNSTTTQNHPSPPIATSFFHSIAISCPAASPCAASVHFFLPTCVLCLLVKFFLPTDILISFSSHPHFFFSPPVLRLNLRACL